MPFGGQNEFSKNYVKFLIVSFDDGVKVNGSMKHHNR